jgi:hypothetical protein
MNSDCCQTKPPAIPRSLSPILLIFFFLFQITIILVFAEKGLAFVLSVILISALFLYSVFSVEKIFYIFAFYVAVAPDAHYLHYFPGFPISYTLQLAIPLFALVLLYWLTYLLKAKEQISFDSLDYTILAYLVFVVIAAVRGFFYGYKTLYFVWDLMSHLWYLSYFIFRYSPLKVNIKRFYDFVLLLVVIVSLEFIYGFTQTEGFIIFRRIVGKNIHLALFGISYIGATIIHGSTRGRKILFAFILPAIILAVFTSQQRSLWLGAIVVMLILVCMYLYSRRQSIIKNARKFLKIAAAVAAATIAVALLIQKQTMILLTVIARALIFVDPSLLKYDISWLIREREIATAMHDLGNRFLFGTGFGASIVSPDRRFILSAPDNAYFYLLWKMGITGLLCFIIIQYLFFKKCFIVLNRSKDTDERVFALTALLNTVGLMIVGLANTCITQYEYLIIWTAIIASIAIIARQYE